MTGARVAVGILVVLMVGGIVGLFGIWQLANSGEVAWTGREPGEAALMSFALWQLAWGVGAPAFGTLAAASAFALVVVGARALAVRWVDHEAARHAPRVAAVDASERGADRERARLDVEVRGDD